MPLPDYTSLLAERGEAERTGDGLAAGEVLADIAVGLDHLDLARLILGEHAAAHEVCPDDERLTLDGSGALIGVVELVRGVGRDHLSSFLLLADKIILPDR